MTRVAIWVEGPTEREFVQHPLTEYLMPRGIYVFPRDLGGNVSVERLAHYMRNSLRDFDCVSSLVDFYGFRRKGNATPNELEDRIRETINRRTNIALSEISIIPYIQRHEFEGLLFSQVDAFSEVMLASEDNVRRLRQIRLSFPTPEDINDSAETAPSKRIMQAIPRYDKRVYGRLIAESIGLDSIRAECPRFNQWLTRLESLGNNQSQNP